MTSGERSDSTERAVAPVLERIDRDLAKARGTPRRMLKMMRDHVLSPRLNVQVIRASLRLRPTDASSAEFKRQLGERPKRYLESRRLEVACRLLLHTDLSPHDVAVRVGYKSFRVFSHAFDKRMGCRPRVYRESGGLMSRKAVPAPTPKPPAADAAGRPRFLAGLAELGDGARCARCEKELTSSAAPRAFEALAPLCDLCAFEHAPRELADFLFVNAPGRRAMDAEELERRLEPEKVLAALRRQLSQRDADALVWALLCRYPLSAGVVGEVLAEQERERRRRLEEPS